MSIHAKFFLYKRTNGYWYVGYFDDGRKRWKSTGCTLKSEALKRLSEFQTLFSKSLPARSLAQFSKEFLDYALMNFAKSGVGIYSVALRNLSALVGDVSLASISPLHADQYKSFRLAQVQARTVNTELERLRAAFYVAQRWQLISSNPFAKVRFVPLPEKSPAYLSKNDFQKFIGLVREEWFRQLVVFTVSTGLRRAEVLNLTWQDIDFDRKLVRIESRGGFRTKAGKRRVVPLNEVALQCLSRRKGKSTCPFLFSLSEARISEDYITHKFKKYARLAGLDPSIHFHGLRHSFATWLVQDGVSLYEVQKLLGHSSSKVTEIYSHLQPEHMHSTVNRIDLQLN